MNAMAYKEYHSGLEAALDIVGGKWKPLILRAQGAGPRRFGELRRIVEGISEKMLIQQLKELERDGVVVRHDYKEVPPRVEYSLTPFGVTLIQALGPLCDWGMAHMDEIRALRAGDVFPKHKRKKSVKKSAA